MGFRCYNLRMIVYQRDGERAANQNPRNLLKNPEINPLILSTIQREIGLRLIASFGSVLGGQNGEGTGGMKVTARVPLLGTSS